MQPIVVLAVLGVAIGALVGTGSLENVINLNDMVQQFGVGEATIGTPITHAYIDWKIEAVPGIAPGNIMNFKNVITQCIINTDDPIPYQSVVICKLTDIDSNVVIEGRKTIIIFPFNPPFQTVTIPINDPNLVLNRIENIHDVILVVKGPSQLVD